MLLTAPVLSYTPKRIVSLVPSQTELLYDLELELETVGITKFCIHPDKWFRNKPRVGGTKSVHMDVAAALQPDLIIANKEENVKEQVEALASLAPVWVSDIHHLDDALQMIRDVGTLTGTGAKAAAIAHSIEKGFDELPSPAPVPTLYLIWREPWMSAGSDTFIHDMLQRAGCSNVCAHLGRYPQLSHDDIRNSGAARVLLSSEPYPFKEKHIDELRRLLPGAEILLADGEMFSWYGSRLLHAPGYFRQLFRF